MADYRIEIQLKSKEKIVVREFCKDYCFRYGISPEVLTAVGMTFMNLSSHTVAICRINIDDETACAMRLNGEVIYKIDYEV